MPFSYHSHSGQFCMHAKGLLEDMVKGAIKKGFTHYGLSEHMPRSRMQDLYPEEKEGDMTPEKLWNVFNDYVIEARRLQEKYKDEIHIIVGLETEFITSGSLEDVSRLVEGHELEYIVGSLHHVDSIPIDYSEELYVTVEKKYKGTEGLFIAYFNSQLSMLQTLKPTIVGHFDLIRIYRKDFIMTGEVWECIRNNIKFVVGYGGLFEINSSAIKYGYGTPYPCEDIVREIITLGGSFTLGDDSHNPEFVGKYFDEVFKYLKKMEIKELYYLEVNEKNILVKKKYEGDILDHIFWKQFGEN